MRYHESTPRHPPPTHPPLPLTPLPLASPRGGSSRNIFVQFATSRVEIAEAREKRHKSDGLISADNSLSRTCRDTRLPARGETPLLMLDRWRKLHDELYDSATGFDISKVNGADPRRPPPCILFIFMRVKQQSRVAVNLVQAPSRGMAI